MAKETLKIFNLNLPNLMAIPLPKIIKELIKTLQNENAEIYLIGGFIRDLLLGIGSCDLDFVVVDKNVSELCKDLSVKYDGNYFVLDKETEVTRLVLKDESVQSFTFDFTSVLKTNLEADFKRRDFTINTLAINLKNPDVLIDKFSGLEDLKQKKIRAVKLENLLDDPLRFLRAFRFASLLQGKIDQETISFIAKNVNHFNDSVSSERIAHELWKILDNNYSFGDIKQMSDIGLLENIIPEMTPMKKVTPNNFHHLWLYDHSLELIKTFEENFFKIPEWAKEELKKPFGVLLSPKKKAISKLGCLLHDIGKPETWEIKNVNEKEKHTFYGHDKLGAEITEKIGERLKFSNSTIQTLSKLVRYHLRPFQLSPGNEPITEKALYRFFRDVGESIPLLLMLAMADLYATVGPEITKDNLVNGEKLILFLFDEYKKYQTREIEKAKKPKLLDGNEIMALTSLKPSRELGVLVKELDEAIALGEVKTKDEAREWVLKYVIRLQ